MGYALAQCRNVLIKHCSLYTNVLLYSLSELQVITTTNIPIHRHISKQLRANRYCC